MRLLLSVFLLCVCACACVCRKTWHWPSVLKRPRIACGWQLERGPTCWRGCWSTELVECRPGHSPGGRRGLWGGRSRQMPLLMAMVVAGLLLVRVCVSHTACQCVVMSAGYLCFPITPPPPPPTLHSCHTSVQRHRQEVSPAANVPTTPTRQSRSVGG